MNRRLRLRTAIFPVIGPYACNIHLLNQKEGRKIKMKKIVSLLLLLPMLLSVCSFCPCC